MNSKHNTRPYRCAIYFTPPPFNDWWQAGSHWLGRCTISGASYAPLDLPEMAPSVFQACTADPRRYGWHGTLKAPFTLSPENTTADLVSRMHELASRLPAFTMPPLRVSTLGDFLALRPDGDTTQVDATAAACVKNLHDLAMPLSPTELERRRKAKLSMAQDRLLVQWGYPWVFEHFQFHLSLSGPLQHITAEQRQALVNAAQVRFHALEPCRFEHLALFIEPEKGADFQLSNLVELRG
jgi:Protein of unknown function (DUF1045)